MEGRLGGVPRRQPPARGPGERAGGPSLAGFRAPSSTRRPRHHCEDEEPRPREVKVRAQGHTASNQVGIGTQFWEKPRVAPCTPQALFPSLQASAPPTSYPAPSLPTPPSCLLNMAMASAGSRAGPGAYLSSRAGAFCPARCGALALGCLWDLRVLRVRPQALPGRAPGDPAQAPAERVSRRGRPGTRGARARGERRRGGAGPGARAGEPRGPRQRRHAGLQPAAPAPAPSVVTSSVRPRLGTRRSSVRRGVAAPGNSPAGPATSCPRPERRLRRGAPRPATRRRPRREETPRAPGARRSAR